MRPESEGSADNISCIKCNESIPDESRFCPACGYSVEGVNLYNPKYFPILAALLSGMVPIFLAASNWKRIGNNARGRYWLLIGFVGFVVLFIAVILMSNIENPIGILLGYLINVSIGLLLRIKQYPVYKAALALGAKSTSAVTGSIKGFGLTLVALIISIVILAAFMTVEENRALAFMEDEKYEEAVLVFKRMMVLNDEDEYIRYNLAICHLYMEHWQEAADGFRYYLKQNNVSPEAHAYLGYVIQQQGLLEDAEYHFATAEDQDPEVLNSMFGMFGF